MDLLHELHPQAVRIAGLLRERGEKIEAYKGMRGAGEDYASLQARSIRDNFGADWGLAESGSVGASKHPSGTPSGTSCAALSGPDGASYTRLLETGSEDRIANMGAFTRNALNLLEDMLK
jgi:nicotinamide mononucleotide (NMN) deamidase PncC